MKYRKSTYFLLFVLISIFGVNNYSQPTDGLVAYFPFNGNANDESGNGNDGTVFGASLTEDRFGKPNSAYSFNGEGNYIGYPSLWSSAPDSITFAAWFNIMTSLEDGKVLYHGDNGEFQIFVAGDSVWGGVHLGQNVTDPWYYVKRATYQNEWQMIAVIWIKGESFRLYLNSELVDSIGVSSDGLLDPGPSYPPSIGSYGRNLGAFFSGVIDDIRIYNRALTGNEIDSLFNEGTTFGQGTDSIGCATIDFETVPGDTVTEGLLINNQFFDSLGISFKLENGDFPRIAEVGAPRTAFDGAGGPDTPAPGQNIGSFFLTDDGLTLGQLSSPLIVNFSFPVDSASGYVLDIDADETFTIEARDSLEEILEQIVITAGDMGTGNGLATLWSFKRDIADIYSIRFEGMRTAGGFFGLGFDNFCSCAIWRVTSTGRIEDNNLPKSFLLEQNYPNPFNPVTKIRYSIPQSSPVTVKVYDVLGKEIEILVKEEKLAGEYELTWDAANLPSGVYFYRIQAENFVETKKMILLR